MTNDMTKGNPARLIIGFMIPTCLGNIFQQFYNLADSMIAGRFIGVNALAARYAVVAVIAGFAGYAGVCFSDPAAWILALVPIVPYYFYKMR